MLHQGSWLKEAGVVVAVVSVRHRFCPAVGIIVIQRTSLRFPLGACCGAVCAVAVHQGGPSVRHHRPISAVHAQQRVLAT
jgi:hypothetical protein